MSSQSIYLTLPEHSFRILKILSADENDIVCELRHFAFDNVPEYIALSYAWGLPDTSASILCNGQAFRITPHLQEALRQLHAFDPSANFWIDAICINQENNEEKAIQTRKMNLVYRSARLVFVWLGKAENGSDIAMDCIEPLNQKFVPILKDGSPENIVFSKGWLENSELTSSGLPSHDDPMWHALGFIYSQTWFTRLWALQEVVLARKIIVAHGAKTIDWDSFVALSKVFSPAVLFTVMTGTPETEEAFRKGLIGLNSYTIAQRIHYGDHFARLPHLLRIGRQKGVTEPVDRIFGLLGMVSNQVSQQIEVDYSIEARQNWWRLYIQYGKLQLQSEGLLGLLSMAASKTRPPELPSWCPNFNSPPKDDFNLALYEPGFVSWKERVKSKVLEIPNSDNLKFSGFRIDRVHVVVGSPEHCYDAKSWEGPGGIVDKLLQYEYNCLELSRKTYNSPDQIPDAHWRTLAADSTAEGKTPLDPDIFEDYLGLKKRWTSLCGKDNVDYFATTTPSERQRIRSYFQAIESKKTRSFFSTDGGRVGLGTCDLQAGDVLCVLYGGAALYVLRFKHSSSSDVEEVAQLIGDAYVHGLMALKSMPGDTRGEDEFFIIG